MADVRKGDRVEGIFGGELRRGTVLWVGANRMASVLWDGAKEPEGILASGLRIVSTGRLAERGRTSWPAG